MDRGARTRYVIRRDGASIAVDARSDLEAAVLRHPDPVAIRELAPEPARHEQQASAAVAGLLLVTGWLGGELAYRHRIGVTKDRGFEV